MLNGITVLTQTKKFVTYTLSQAPIDINEDIDENGKNIEGKNYNDTNCLGNNRPQFNKMKLAAIKAFYRFFVESHNLHLNRETKNYLSSWSDNVRCKAISLTLDNRT